MNERHGSSSLNPDAPKNSYHSDVLDNPISRVDSEKVCCHNLSSFERFLQIMLLHSVEKKAISVSHHQKVMCQKNQVSFIYALTLNRHFRLDDICLKKYLLL